MSGVMKRIVNINTSLLEKICSIALFAAGTVFLVLALCGAWKYLCTMAICYAAGILVKEDIDEDEKKARK